VEAFIGLHFEDHVVKALETGIHLVDFTLFDDGFGKKFSEFVIGVSIRIETNV
jgi:hypothetical protein